MNEELDALWDNETFELTPLPEGRASVGGGGGGGGKWED